MIVSRYGNLVPAIRHHLLFGYCPLFSLKPGPEVPYEIAPDEVRVYLNTHDAVRNQLAFGFFGIATLLSLMTTNFLNRRQIWAIFLIALLIPALEIAQTWLPERHVDTDDVLNGWLGLGLVHLYAGIWWLRKIAVRSNSENQP